MAAPVRRGRELLLRSGSISHRCCCARLRPPQKRGLMRQSNQFSGAPRPAQPATTLRTPPMQHIRRARLPIHTAALTAACAAAAPLLRLLLPPAAGRHAATPPPRRAGHVGGVPGGRRVVLQQPVVL